MPSVQSICSLSWLSVEASETVSFSGILKRNLFTYSFIDLLIYLFIYLFICLFIYVFIYLFYYLFIYLSILKFIVTITVKR